MGNNFIDFWTFLHFIFGIISTSTILPKNKNISIFVANFLHLILELFENNKNNKTSEILESTSNHIGDILAFFIGSLIGYFYGCKYFSNNNITRYILLVLSFAVFLQEILREIFPNDWIFDPSYKPIKW